MSSIRTKAFVWFLLAASCGDDGSDKRLYANVLEVKSFEVGPNESMVSLGRGRTKVDVIVPGGALPTRTRVSVTLVSGVVARGRAPANGRGVVLEPSSVVFQTPARVRQAVAPAPAGRRYRTVVALPGSDAFVVRRAAIKVSGASAETEGDEIWEGESEGAGLWGLALEEAGDDGVAAADAGVPLGMGGAGAQPSDAGQVMIADAQVVVPIDPGAGGASGAGARAVDAGTGGVSGSGGAPDAGTVGVGGNMGAGGTDAGASAGGGSGGFGGGGGFGGFSGTDAGASAGGGSGGFGGIVGTDAGAPAGGGSGGFGGSGGL